MDHGQELIRKTKDSVLKEKEDEDARLKAQARRLDYITRALRLEEMPILRRKYENQVRAHVLEQWMVHLAPMLTDGITECMRWPKSPVPHRVRWLLTEGHRMIPWLQRVWP